MTFSNNCSDLYHLDCLERSAFLVRLPACSYFQLAIGEGVTNQKESQRMWFQSTEDIIGIVIANVTPQPSLMDQVELSFGVKASYYAKLLPSCSFRCASPL